MPKIDDAGSKSSSSAKSKPPAKRKVSGKTKKPSSKVKSEPALQGKSDKKVTPTKSDRDPTMDPHSEKIFDMHDMADALNHAARSEKSATKSSKSVGSKSKRTVNAKTTAPTAKSEPRVDERNGSTAGSKHSTTGSKQSRRSTSTKNRSTSTKVRINAPESEEEESEEEESLPDSSSSDGDSFNPRILGPGTDNVEDHVKAHHLRGIWEILTKDPLFQPLRVKHSGSLWGPLVEPNWENAMGDRTLLMEEIAHMLVTVGFFVKTEGIPVNKRGEPYFVRFSVKEILTVGRRLQYKLTAILGSSTAAKARSPVRNTVETPGPRSNPRGSQARPVTPPHQDPISDPGPNMGTDPNIDPDPRFVTPPMQTRPRDPDGDVMMQSATPVRQSVPMANMDPTSSPPIQRKLSLDHAEESTTSRDYGELPRYKGVGIQPRMSRDDEFGDIDAYMGVEAKGKSMVCVRSTQPTEIKDFSGRIHDDEKARQWLGRLFTVGRRDQLSGKEMCDLFRDHLIPPAKNWFRQLDPAVRRSWIALVDRFERQFCDKGIHHPERYYNLSRFNDEDPLAYLYRLNVAAGKAKIPFRGKDMEQAAHVDRFLTSVNDPDLVRMLSMVGITSTDDLEATLVDVARNERRISRRAESSKARTFIPRAVKRDTPAKVNVVYAAPTDMMDPEPNEPDPEWDPSRSHRRAADQQDPDGDEFNQDDEGAPPQVMATTATRPGAPSNDRSKSDPGRSPCATCGSTLHTTTGCWKTKTCSYCRRQGHPSDRCSFVCRACLKIHDRGECEYADFLNRMYQWYDPKKHAGLFPAEIEKTLKENAR